MESEILLEYLSKSADELYAEIGRQDQDVYYDLGAAIVRGKQIFASLWPQLRNKVCSAYKSRPAALSSLIDLTVLVLTAVNIESSKSQIPQYAVAALIVKSGLEDLCVD